MNQYMHIGGYCEVTQNSIFSATLPVLPALLELSKALAQVRELPLVMQVTDFPSHVMSSIVFAAHTNFPTLEDVGKDDRASKPLHD